MYWHALKTSTNLQPALQLALEEKLQGPNRGRAGNLGSLWYTNRYEEQFATQLDSHAILARVYGNEVANLLPALHEILPAQLQVEFVQYFVARAHSAGPVHIDGNVRHCALNFPVHGADKGTMEWFAGDAFDRAFVNNTRVGTRVPGARTELWKAIPKTLDSFPAPVAYLVLTEPFLVNSGEWHRVNNTRNDEYRIVASVRFVGNPTFEDAKCLLG